jgi:diacylglycerol kinase (ATP)
LKLHFIVNPVAGRGRAMRVWQALQKHLVSRAVEFTYSFTQGPGHATELARQAVARTCGACVGVGGDGTLHEMLPALMGTETALGCIPAGTGNDFARGLGLPRTVERQATMLAVAKRRTIDVPSVNGEPFLNVAGAGFDAVVADTVNRSFRALHGPIPYILAIFRTLVSYHNAPLSIRLDDGPPNELRCLLVAGGNLQYYGGGMKICPMACPGDGSLDFCIAGDLSKIDALCTLPRLLRGTHIYHPKCTYLRARKADIDGPPLPIQADGQIVGTLPATFTLQPQALWVLQPAGGDT